MFGAMLRAISNLENIDRFSNKIMLNRTNDASHTCFVSLIASVLAFKEREYGNEVDMEELLLRCLYHDVIEVYTGDILSYVKRSTPEMKEELGRIEELFFEDFKHLVPNGCEDDFKRFMLEGKDDTIEGKILKAADYIDVLREASIEVRLGNKEEFEPIIEGTLEKLWNVDLRSVRDFRAYELESFGVKL